MRENIGKVYFYDPGNILNDLAKNEELRRAIRQLAEQKHPDILTDSLIYTGWEKRLYSKDGYRRHRTLGSFILWQDTENIRSIQKHDRELLAKIKLKYIDSTVEKSE